MIFFSEKGNFPEILKLLFEIRKGKTNGHLSPSSALPRCQSYSHHPHTPPKPFPLPHRNAPLPNLLLSGWVFLLSAPSRALTVRCKLPLSVGLEWPSQQGGLTLLDSPASADRVLSRELAIAQQGAGRLNEEF